MTARDKMLEEKRQKFLKKTGQLSDNNNNNNNKRDPPPQQQQQQQQQVNYQQQQQVNPHHQHLQQQQQMNHPPHSHQQQQVDYSHHQQQQQFNHHQHLQQQQMNHPTSLQYGDKGDDGASEMAEIYGKKKDSYYRSKPKKLQVVVPTSDDPFNDGQEDKKTGQDDVKNDPFSHTVRPKDMQSLNNDDDVNSGLGIIGKLLLLLLLIKRSVLYNLLFVLIGGKQIDNKEARRNKQAEYARQLEQDQSSINQQQQQQHHRNRQEYQQDSVGGGLSNIGDKLSLMNYDESNDNVYSSVVVKGQHHVLNDKEVKKHKQAEYARQLQQDHAPAQQPHHNQQRLHDENRGGGGLGDIGVS